jgi:hypothetical protein
LFSPWLSGNTSVAPLSPVGNFTPPPTIRFQLRPLAGSTTAKRASDVMSPRPRAFSLARAAGPPARGDGMPHDASTNGIPAFRLMRFVS